MSKSIPLHEVLKDHTHPSASGIDNAVLSAVNEEIRYVDRGWYLAVEFEFSTSSRFQQALDTARKNAYFAELVDEKGSSIFRAIYFKRDFPPFLDLYDIIGKWKNTRFYFKGKEIFLPDMEEWLLSFRAYWGHRKTLNINDYCGLSKTNPWPDFLGCYDRNIYLRWRDPFMLHYYHLSRIWYTFGKRLQDRFLIDKEAMRHFLNNLNQSYHPCPTYGHHLIEQTLQKLPDALYADHKFWAFREDYIRTNQKRGLFYHYDIALSVLPEICPLSDKMYYKFLESCYRSGT